MVCRADDLALGMLVATLWVNPQSRRRLQERVGLFLRRVYLAPGGRTSRDVLLDYETGLVHDGDFGTHCDWLLLRVPNDYFP